MNFNLKLLSVLLFSTCSACGVSPFVQPKANPIIIDRTPEGGEYVQTVATTAERRLVLVKHVGTEEEIALKQSGIFVNEGFCAEPSPDSIEALAASFDLGAKNTLSSSSQEVGIGQALATSAALATKRTQGLQFYRDTIFGLCQARMNGFMSNDEFKVQLRFAREAAVQLILAEIRSKNFNTQPTINVVVTPPKPKE